MSFIIRKAKDEDIEYFVKYSVKLSEFNRSKHNVNCKYDDYSIVLEAITKKAKNTFLKRDDNMLILMVESNNTPVGYALGRIYEEEKTADNGTGQVGLFDELYIENSIRGNGIGKKLVDEIISWFKVNKINRIKLHAYSWNENAKKLYEKLGFNEYAVSYEKFI